MTYELHTLTGRSRHLVGTYDDYPTALRARVDDVLQLLRANDGWWTRAEHVIIGPGVDGPVTEHPLCTELGIDPADGRLPDPSDFDDARAWLLFAHDLPADTAPLHRDGKRH